MIKRLSSPSSLTASIERRIIESGADGLTYNIIMDEMKIGRTCARNHLSMLESLGRIYRVRRVQPGRTAIYYTYHHTDIKGASLLSKNEMFDLKAGATPRRRTFQIWAPHNHRDPLVAALFGPARREH